VGEHSGRPEIKALMQERKGGFSFQRVLPRRKNRNTLGGVFSKKKKGKKEEDNARVAGSQANLSSIESPERGPAHREGGGGKGFSCRGEK